MPRYPRLYDQAQMMEGIPGSPVRVLIVDDQAPFRAAARGVVELLENFEVVGEAETGESSIEAVATLHPDLVLMDVNLPDIDGFEATRRILEEGGNGFFVIALSTYEKERYEGPALQSGAVAYIPKSEFGPEQLVAAWNMARETTHFSPPET